MHVFLPLSAPNKAAGQGENAPAAALICRRFPTALAVPERRHCGQRRRTPQCRHVRVQELMIRSRYVSVMSTLAYPPYFVASTPHERTCMSPRISFLRELTHHEDSIFDCSPSVAGLCEQFALHACKPALEVLKMPILSVHKKTSDIDRRFHLPNLLFSRISSRNVVSFIHKVGASYHPVPRMIHVPQCPAYFASLPRTHRPACTLVLRSLKVQACHAQRPLVPNMLIPSVCFIWLPFALFL